MDEIKNYGNKKIIYVLIGNKKDLANKFHLRFILRREVSFEDG
jgi:hypothetical protein